MPASTGDHAALLGRLERYYDAAPRSSARTEEIGPFTLFVSSGGWPYYARPRLDGPRAFSPEDIAAVRSRQRELEVPEAFEWVHETTPELTEPMRGTGMALREHPLMVLAEPLRAGPPEGVRVRLLDADDPALPSAQAVAAVGFAHAGTASGDAGAGARDAAAGVSGDTAMRERLRRGLTVMAVAEDASGPICVGSCQPVGEVAEIVGVATLPAARRRGLGAAVTATLVDDARRRGVDLVFLSAGGDDVARVYGRVGFRRVGTACIAEPAG